VTFPAGLEGLAQEATVAAEEAHQYLLTKLGYAPSEKIDIVLCDATDTAHRELDVFQNKITICVAQGDLAERFNPKFPSWVQQSVFSALRAACRALITSSGSRRCCAHCWASLSYQT
jgi:hypothetical protein